MDRQKVVSDGGKFSTGSGHMHLFPVWLVLQGGLSQGGLSKEVLLYI